MKLRYKNTHVLGVKDLIDYHWYKILSIKVKVEGCSEPANLQEADHLMAEPKVQFRRHHLTHNPTHFLLAPFAYKPEWVLELECEEVDEA